MGCLGGFIFDFLGTAMPRMLSAPPLRKFEMLSLLLVHFTMVAFYAFGNIPVGNGLFLLLLLGFATAMAPRIRHRKDLPPPGFILVGLSMACAASGAVLGVFNGPDTDLGRQALEKLLTYQGFVLLPILGIGPFILPRFFGLQSSHDFPESLAPSSNCWPSTAGGPDRVAMTPTFSFSCAAAPDTLRTMAATPARHGAARARIATGLLIVPSRVMADRPAPAWARERPIGR